MEKHEVKSGTPIYERNLEPLFFRFHGKLVRLLGRESVSNSIAALLELIKNSYDSDATELKIVFNSIKTDKGTITLKDNGSGLTSDQLDKLWMTIGTDVKEKEPYTPGFHRRKTGEKGIGRFATEKLARSADIISKPKNSAHGSRLKIDWDEFEKATHVDKIPIPLSEFKKKKNDRGFEITLSRLRDKWDETELQKLRKSVALVVPPFSRFQHPLSIKVECPEFPLYTGKVKGELLKQAVFILNAKLEENGIVNYQFRAKNEVPKKEQCALKGLTCGPVDFTMHFFYRDKGKYPNENIIDIKAIRDMLDGFGGVHLYRDNFRIQLQEFDWIGLDALRINDPSNYPSNSQVIGIVRIGKEKNPSILDTTTREGIIENEAFKSLKDFLKKSIEFFVEKRKESEKKKTRRRRKTMKAISTSKAKPEILTPESLLDFKRKYPEVFYVPLEKEINSCYSSSLFNATLLLSRKLLENLVFNIFELHFPKEVALRWDTNKNKPHNFSTLLDNLKTRKGDFDPEQQRVIDTLLPRLKPFKREANSKAHNIMAYIDKKGELDLLKIPETAELVLKVINKLKV